MRKNAIIKISLFVILFLFFFTYYAECSVGSLINKANRLYHKGKYDDALKYYNKAEVELSDSEILSFNKGTTLYKKGDYKDAIKNFNKALLSSDPELEQKAAYNIGNCKYKLGSLKENIDLASAISFYREALDYYKRAIELNQDYKNAKYNYEFVAGRLKMLLNKQKEKKKSEKQSQTGKDKKTAETTGVSSKKKEGGGEKKKADVAQQDMNRKKTEETSTTGIFGKSDEYKKEDKSGKRLQERQEPKGKISEQEAKILLRRYDQKGRFITYNQKESKKARFYPPVLKDW